MPLRVCTLQPRAIMIILNPTIATDIKNGKIEIILKDNDACRWKVGSTHRIFSCHPANGGKDLLGVKILSTVQIPLEQISEAEAYMAGYKSCTDLLDSWKKRRKQFFDPTLRVWMIGVEPERN